MAWLAAASNSVIRMWFEKALPDALLVKNIKLYMRLTLGLWVATALFGIALYFTWYSDDAGAAGGDGSPALTEEPQEPGADGLDPAATANATEDPAAAATQAPTELGTEAPSPDAPIETSEVSEASTSPPEEAPTALATDAAPVEMPTEAPSPEPAPQETPEVNAGE